MIIRPLVEVLAAAVGQVQYRPTAQAPTVPLAKDLAAEMSPKLEQTADMVLAVVVQGEPGVTPQMTV